jgi:hypothetical protein
VSASRQALILSRRQTQQRPSEEFGATSVPQTEHFAPRLMVSGVAERFAFSRISLCTTGAWLGLDFRFIGYF